LDQVGVTLDSTGFIVTNDRMQTTNAAIYAVGDVTGGPPQAHLAMKQGKIAAENIAGLTSRYWVQAVPRVIWTEPQIATVGLTAKQAEAAGYQVVTGRVPFDSNGRSLTLNAPEGFVLIVAEQDTGVLLGILIVSEQAESLIGEAALALEMGATLTDLAETLHPHPSLGETLQESAEVALGSAIHLFNERMRQ
jgi:dihydrolipoamide dehydrogenase